MIETLLITFREGLEAFLIVAITLAYLQKTGRNHLVKAVYAGVVTALIISATTGWHIAEMADTPLMEGTLAMVAGIMVASLTYYIMKTAKTIKLDITNKIDCHANKTGFPALLGIFIFTVLMISREGMETALMLGAISSNVESQQLIFGAVLGILLTGLIGVLWVRNSHLINLRIFMQVTGVFLFLFSIHLFLYGVYELTEVESSIFYAPDFHAFIKPVASTKEPIGQAIVYSLLIIPCTWLAFVWAKRKLESKKLVAAE
jgi:high-affinity iron transporter